MEIYQWLVPLISLFYIIRLYRRLRARRRMIKGSIFWLIFWVSISILAILPDVVSFQIAETFGFKDHINAVIFVAIGFQFLFLYYLSSSVDKLEKQMTQFVRKMALDQAKKKEKREKVDQEV